MALALENEVYAVAGGTLAHATGAQVRILRGSRRIGLFEVEKGVWWLKVSPDGRSVLAYESNVPRIWRWREDEAVDLWAVSKGTRDSPGCGFLKAPSETLTLLAQGESLRGFTANGAVLFTANIRSPSSYYPRAFSPLPGGRVALIGHFFGDSSDSIITVEVAKLLSDPDAVQAAIRAQVPINDRAVQITVGPCGSDAAVVYRNPEQDEPPDDEAREDLDIYGLSGLYVRHLESGTLIEQHSWSGAANSYSILAATTARIAVQVADGVEFIERATGAVRRVPAAILDPLVAHIIRIEDEGFSEPTALDKIVLAPNQSADED